MNVGSRIKETRATKRISRAALAKAANVPYSTLADLENGYMKTSTRLLDIARALGVSAYWLQSGAGSKSAQEESAHKLAEPKVQYRSELQQSIEALAHAIAALPDTKRAPAADLLAAISRSPTESVLQDSLCKLLANGHPN